jgi:ribonuclease P protein component
MKPMLAKVNRINAASDFRLVMRKGRRVPTQNTVISIMKSGETATRFGFVVGKTAGNAVTRKALSRKLREIAREFITTNPTGFDIVIRFTGKGEKTTAELKTEVLSRLK